MSNQLNIISPNFRDVLLHKNLIVSESITLYAGGLSMASNLGTIAETELPSMNVIDSPDIVNSAISYRNNNLKINKYDYNSPSEEELFSSDFTNSKYYSNPVSGGYDTGMPSKDSAPNPTKPENLLLVNPDNVKARKDLLAKNLIFSETISRYGNPSDNLLTDFNSSVDIEKTFSNIIDSPDIIDTATSTYKPKQLKVNKYNSGDVSNDELYSVILNNSVYLKNNINGPYIIGDSGNNSPNPNSNDNLLLNNTVNNDARIKILAKNLNLSEILSNYSSNILPDLNQDRALPFIPSNSTDNVVNNNIDIVVDSNNYNLTQILVNRYKPDNDNTLFDASITSASSDYEKNITSGPYATNSGLVDQNNTVVLKSDTITALNNNTKLNQYIDNDSIIAFDNSNNYLPQYSILNEDYISYMNDIIPVNGIIKTGNLIGTLLTGQGIGISPNGPVSNFDIKTTIAGRVLGATGIINDTPIGKAGQSGLAFAMLNNVAFNIEKNTVGLINTDITSLIAGAPLVGRSYKITNTGVVSNLLEIMTGAQLPKSLLPDDASIFYFNNKSGLPLIELVSKNQSLFNTLGANQKLIDNTGNGQWDSLFSNLKATWYNRQLQGGGYVPAYSNKKDSLPEGLTYLNQSDSYDSTKKIAGDLGLTQFTWPDSSTITDTLPITWNNTNQKSLLQKTQELFKSKKITTMVNNLSGSTINSDSDIENGVGDNRDKISKGNQVLSSDGKTFCRTWSTLKRYGENYTTLQRHRGLDKNGGIRLSDVNSSVLDQNGFVRIAPTSQQKDMKRFMFSLENLAWCDDLSNLRQCEIGPGDILSKKQGRIMWFPPYDLKFSEQSNAKYDSTEFIGRGEPIYTYNNTERSGQLSFKIITDHSTRYNSFKKSAIADINKFIFGCDEIPAFINNNISPTNKANIEVLKAKNNPNQSKQIDGSHSERIELYYLNDISDPQKVLDLGYENNTLGTGISYIEGTPTQPIPIVGENNDRAWPQLTYDKLNEGFINNLTRLIKIAATDDAIQIQILGYATEQGTSDFNTKLAAYRAFNMQGFIQDNLSTILSGNQATLDNFKNNIDKKFGYVGLGTNSGYGEGIIQVPPTLSQDSHTAKLGRKCTISLLNNPNLSINNQATLFNKNKETDNSLLPDGIENDLFCESSYFDYLYDTSPLVYKSITDAFKEQIKYFQPAFHSITPEGFNERLNFLLQCTRQGPTADPNNNNPNNLAFGRPPVCILRIGDLYHTKIIINDVQLNFQDVTWDLNPEGIGVQPMIVDVTMSFKFIGGSSLNGPISKLQNAVSFNFFANTEMYDNRADRIFQDKLINGATTEEDKMTRDDATMQNVNDEYQLNTAEITNSIQNDKNDDIFIINHIGTQSNNTLIVTLDGNMLSIYCSLSSPNKALLSKDYTIDYRINKDIIRKQVNLTHSDGKINSDSILTFDWSIDISGLDTSRVATYIDIDAYIQELDLSFIGNTYVLFNQDCPTLNVNIGDFELVLDSETQRLKDINDANTYPTFCSGLMTPNDTTQLNGINLKNKINLL